MLIASRINNPVCYLGTGAILQVLAEADDVIALLIDIVDCNSGIVGIVRIKTVLSQQVVQ